MLRFTSELEDVSFSAVRDDNGWRILLSESEQAQKDFPKDEPLTAELCLTDQEMAALLYLAANNDDPPTEEFEAVCLSCYKVIEPKLAGLPNELRPIP